MWPLGILFSISLERKSDSFFSLRLDHAEPDYVDEICPWNGNDCVVYRTTLAPTTTKAPTPKPEPSPEPNPEPTAEPEKQTTIKYVINCKSREILFRPNFRTPFLKKKLNYNPCADSEFFSPEGVRGLNSVILQGL